jgi:hypothetical protein
MSYYNISCVCRFQSDHFTDKMKLSLTGYKPNSAFESTIYSFHNTIHNNLVKSYWGERSFRFSASMLDLSYLKNYKHVIHILDLNRNCSCL